MSVNPFSAEFDAPFGGGFVETLSPSVGVTTTDVAVSAPTPPPATAPGLSPDVFASRIAALFPNGWAGEDAKQTGNFRALLLSAATELYAVSQGVVYDRLATRFLTATAPELDLASVDFLGNTLPRPSGMSDAAFAQLIISTLFRPADTRPAILQALATLCGQPPRLLEPWNVLDTGWWSGGSYWNVDTPANPARWGSGGLRYQGFIETTPPVIPAVGNNNPVLTWGTAYWNVPGYFFGIISTTPASAVYDLVNRIKAEGTIAWVRFVSNIPSTQTPVAPSQVVGLQVSIAESSAQISWQPPLKGYPKQYAYTVFYKVTGTSTWQSGPTVLASPATVTGLQANVSYDFEVIVRNTVGQAVSSVATATTLKVPPGPATNLVVTNLGATLLTLSWQLPTTGTPPFVCYARYRVTGTTDWVPFGTAGNYTTITITGLQPSTAYDLDVVTSNA